MKKLIVIVLAFITGIHSISQSPRILVPFRSGSKWGYSDTLGKIKIQPVYDSVSLFNYNAIYNGNHVIAYVRLKGKPTAINEMGTVMVTPKYDQVRLIEILGELKDLAFFVFKNSKVGVYTKGKELFPPIYDYMDVAPGVQFKVHRNGKWGLINSEGLTVIPVIYDDLRQIYNNNNPGVINWEAITYGKESKSYIIKAEQGFGSSQIPPELEELREVLSRERLNKAIDSVKTEYGFDSVLIQKKSAIVYKGTKQGVFLPSEIKKIYFFSKDYAIHHTKYFDTYERNNWNNFSVIYIIANLNGKFGIMNEAEKLVLPFDYDSIEEKDGFFLLKRNGKTGFFTWNSFYPVIQPVYDEYVGKEYIPVNNEWNFTLFKVMKNGKSGFVGENGIAFFKD